MGGEGFRGPQGRVQTISILHRSNMYPTKSIAKNAGIGRNVFLLFIDLRKADDLIRGQYTIEV